MRAELHGETVVLTGRPTSQVKFSCQRMGSEIGRWPRELLVFHEDGFDIRFQSCIGDVKVHAMESDVGIDLSEIIAEMEAKFAFQFPQLFKSLKIGECIQLADILYRTKQDIAL